MSLRILCISPLFAPAASAEGFCANKMTQALQGCGASVTVLVRHQLFRGIGQDGSRMWDSLRASAVNVPKPPDSNRLRALAAAIRFQTPIYPRWIAGVVKNAELLHRQKPFDVIYSRSMPMAAHVAGFWCAQKLQLPWIANLNDPWSFSLYRKSGSFKPSGFAARNLLFWLRRTLRHADLITYPCERLHRFHVKLAARSHDAQIIPHIGRASARISSQSRASHGQFRLVHAGMLGASDKTGRSTAALLLGLNAFFTSSPAAAARMKLVLVGPEDPQTEAQIRDLVLATNVEIVGRVDYETSLEHIASASVCVLLEAVMEEGIFLPSKLADYIACRKPVLAISPRIGTAADLAARGELTRVDHDPEAVREAIAGLFADFERGTLDARAPSPRLVHEFSAQAVAQRFLGLCQELISKDLPHAGHNSRAARTAIRPPKYIPLS